MNIVQNAMEAQRELRKAEKTLRNFEILSESLSAEIVRMHAPRLKSARANLEAAKNRVARAKESVKIHIKLLKAHAKVRAAKKR